MNAGLGFLKAQEGVASRWPSVTAFQVSVPQVHPR